MCLMFHPELTSRLGIVCTAMPVLFLLMKFLFCLGLETQFPWYNLKASISSLTGLGFSKKRMPPKWTGHMVPLQLYLGANSVARRQWEQCRDSPKPGVMGPVSLWEVLCPKVTWYPGGALCTQPQA